MSTTKAFKHAALRGLAMAVNPQQEFEKEQRRIAMNSDSVAQAWAATGQSLRWAMDQEKTAQQR